MRLTSCTKVLEADISSADADQAIQQNLPSFLAGNQRVEVHLPLTLLWLMFGIS